MSNNAMKMKAINWNAPENQFYDDLYRKQAEQFWLPEEIPVTDDIPVWRKLDPQLKDTYKKILAGLTLLDTEQATGVNEIASEMDNLFIQHILAFFGGFETIHARSYSTIFQTLCTTSEIDELFAWVENTKTLQNKVANIINKYQEAENGNNEAMFMSMIGSLCLEGICFYSGFYLPLLLAGQGQMINSGEIINLILRDEKLHTVGMGFFAKGILAEVDEAEQKRLKALAIELIEQVYEAELEYSKDLYKELGCIEDVKTYLQFNTNYALGCVDFEPMFPNVTQNEVNPIVMNGYSTETKTHDFFSTKGNGYIKTTKVEEIDDSDFNF